jgi:glucose-1-phosphate adenylyltransferase
VFAYDFWGNTIHGAMPYEEKGYWRDVGTIPAYFEAHMDMLGDAPLFEVNNKSWPINPSGFIASSTKILRGNIRNSIIADGTIIHKAKMRNSVIRSDVIIENDVTLESCIIMDHVVLKKGCSLKRVIVDKLNVIGEGEQIGFDPDKDRFRCHVDQSGISIIPRGGSLIRALKDSQLFP